MAANPAHTISPVPSGARQLQELDLACDGFDLMRDRVTGNLQIVAVEDDGLRLFTGNQVQFGNWKELVQLCEAITFIGKQEPFASAFKELLPDELRAFESWMIQGKVSVLPKATMNQREKIHDKLHDRFLAGTPDLLPHLRHQRVALAELEIAGNEAAGPVTLSRPDGQTMEMSARQLVSLVIHVLSDSRTEECDSWNYAPFLFCADVARRLAECTDYQPVQRAAAPAPAAETPLPQLRSSRFPSHADWIRGARTELGEILDELNVR